MHVEKTEYKPGETVRGLITLHTDEVSRARQFRLFAEGKESTSIKVEESTRGHSSSGRSKWDTNTYSEVNTFFSEDLSHILQKSVSSNALEDGTLEIPPQTKEVTVEFALPSESKLYSSYKGKNANVTYSLKATADIAKKLDVNKEITFSVINPNNNKVRDMASGYGDHIATAENEDVSFPSTSIAEELDNYRGKESYSASFERIFGRKTDHTTETRDRYPGFHGRRVSYDLGTLLTKGREKYLKENSEARIDLLSHGNNNNSTVFSSGQTLRGNVIALSLQNLGEENKKKSVRGMKITLSGIEHAFAQGFQRVSTTEKYEIKAFLLNFKYLMA